MGRWMWAVLTLLVAAPMPLMAQLTEPIPPGIMLRPFVGYRVTHSHTRTILLSAGGASEGFIEEERVEPGPTVGAELTIPVAGRFSAVAAFTYGFSADSRTTSFSAGGSGFGFNPDAGTMMFMKVGLDYQFVETEPRLRMDRPAAGINIGPAVVRHDPGDFEGAGALADPLWHPAVALGANAMIPLSMWPALAVYAGIDDYITFWNDATEAERLAEFRGTQLGTSVRAQVDSDIGNLFLVRAGLNLRF